MPDLSVLIPARNERWIARTVDDVLAHAQGDTEVIVVLDGAWADPPLPQHPRLTVIYLPVSIGQRAATNLAARVSTARHVMKLDAHCALGEGFDVVLHEAAQTLGPDVWQVPVQYNLHVHDWVCETCGARTYQAPPLTACATCGGPVRVDEVWQRRERRKTTAWVFDESLHFQYAGAHQRRQTGEMPETMSLLGACWCVDRATYWRSGGLDEATGSWGQMGTEIACKAWLGGGRVVVNTRTWFAHYFRVGGIGFPYPITAREQDAAREHSRRVWRGNAWPGQVRPLSWLVEHFWPVPGWTDEQRAAVRAEGEAWQSRAPAVVTRPTLGVLAYTDGELDERIARPCRRQLREAIGDRPLVTVSLRPRATVPTRPSRPRVNGYHTQAPSTAIRLTLDLPRGPLTLFRQILAGLERLDTDYVAFAEHDVLYPAAHFDEAPFRDDVYLYDVAVWKLDTATGRAVTVDCCEQTSGLIASRALLLDHYRRRVAHVEAHGFSRRLGFEPGKPTRHGGLDDVPRLAWRASVPLVDLRHGQNLTPSRWRPEDFRDQRYTAGWTEADAVPGWGRTSGRMTAFLREVCDGDFGDDQRKVHPAAHAGVL